MVRLAFWTVRGRWPALLGAFAALAAGAALVISAVEVIVAVNGSTQRAPERYRAAPIVVSGAAKLTVQAGSGGGGETVSDPNSQRRPVPAALAGRVLAVAGVRRVVVDRTVMLRGAAFEGRPWSARLATPYRLVAGRAPRRGDEVVVTAPARLGTTMHLVTPAGPSRFRVVGVVLAAGGAEEATRPVFFSDREAARLAPHVSALAVWPAAAAGRVGELLERSAPGLVALTGGRRADAEPNPDLDAASAGSALVSVMAMTVGFAAVFTLALTFAFVVALRRRELGLLRAVGATPRQVRRLVLREMGIVALLGSAVGAAVSLLIAPALGHWLVARGLAPEGMRVSPLAWAWVVGAGSMLVVALAGAWATARRASRVRPAEALREAAVDRGLMTPTRWLIGLLSLGGAAALATQGLNANFEDELVLTFGQAVALIVGLTMLAPLLIPRIVALLALPAAAGRGAGPLLVRAHARAAVRRTTALAAPVLVAVGLTAAFAVLVDTIQASNDAVERQRIAPGAVVVTANGSPGLSANDLAALRRLPGARVGAVLDTEVRSLSGGELGPTPASGIDPQDASLVLRTPVTAGSLRQLRGMTAAVGELVAQSQHLRVGQTLQMWLPDGTPRRLRVVAVVADGLTGEIYLPRSLLAGHAGPLAATTAYVTLAHRDESSLAALRGLAAARDLTLSGAIGYHVADLSDSSNMNPLALKAILGVTILYVLIALASTAAVATVARAGELAMLRLAGATPAQVLRLVAAEALAATVVGTLLAGVAGAVGVLALRRSLQALHGPAVVSIPWPLLLALALTCAAVAVVASLLAAWRSQQPPPHQLIATLA